MKALLGLFLVVLSYYTLEVAKASTTSGQSKHIRESWIVGNHNPTSSELSVNRGSSVGSIPPRGGGGNVLTTTQRTIPTFFSGEDAREYDTYAACLAATEGLRRIRDRQRLVDPIAARRQYVRDSKPLLETLGMTIDRFNVVGAQIADDEALKEKVSKYFDSPLVVSCIYTDRRSLFLLL